MHFLLATKFMPRTILIIVFMIFPLKSFVRYQGPFH